MTDLSEMEQEPLVQDELASLKKRADQIGLKYHHNVGVPKLKAQIEAFLSNGGDLEEIEESTDEAQEAPTRKQETRAARVARLRKEATRLVRVRVTNMNPNKREWDGEIYTVSNSVIGTVKKYVPFNAENGWHVPQIMLNHMLEKECQIFYTTTAPNGQKIRKGKLIKELSIEILPPLTGKELNDLANRQAMAAGGTA